MKTQKLKIGLSCYPTYGGSGVIATELGLRLARNGCEIHFITYAPPERLDSSQERIFFHKVKVPEYPLFEYRPYSLALASVMAEVAKDASLDLINAHYAIPHAASAYLAKSMLDSKLKIITTLHGTDITLVGAEPSFLPTVKFCLRKSDGITAVSRFLAAETKKIFALDNPIEVIPNFVDGEHFQRRTNPLLRRRFALDQQPVLIHISNFRPVKRPGDLLKILSLVNQKHNAVLLLIGDGPLRSDLELRSQQMNLSDKVHFLGQQAEIVDLLSIADIYLSTSEMESFGLSALEAMSCSLPVVSTNVGGIPEVIEDGKEGFLLDVGDTGAMADKILKLLENDDLRLKMGNNARLKALNLFNAEKIVQLYYDYYLKVLMN